MRHVAFQAHLGVADGLSSFGQRQRDLDGADPGRIGGNIPCGDDFRGFGNAVAPRAAAGSQEGGQSKEQERRTAVGGAEAG